jgi:protein-L-isoaspartate(D-aspartate) O-methyltransferase
MNAAPHRYHDQAAFNMIHGQLITNKILDPRVLQALADVPRELFVPEKLRGAAYADEDLSMGNGRFLMSPLTFARLINLAEITPSCRVLNIGCLNGYTATVLGILAGHVVATELDAGMVDETLYHLNQLGVGDVNVQLVKSLPEGYALSAPYDVILVSGAVDFIPDDLATQLSVSGRLVAVRRAAPRPGVAGGLGKGISVRRIGGHLNYREHFDDATAMLPGFERSQRFTF